MDPSKIKGDTAIDDAEHLEDITKSETATNTLLYDAGEEKKAVRKLDWHLLTVLGLINLCNFLDRSNIGNAYAAGMGKEWGITSNDYSWLITILFLAYMGFIWLILLWKFASPPILVMCASFGWGAVSMLQSVTTSFAGMMICRLFLGVFEAAFTPGIPLFLSFYYNRREIGLRLGLFYSAAPLASCFASALSYGILQANTSLQGWQLLFLVEASPAIVVAIIAGYILPSTPNKCRFLTPRENEIVASRAIKGRGVEEEGRLNLKQALAAFYDYKNYLSAVIFFMLNSCFNALPAFLPTIVAQIGIGDKLASQGLTAPPFLLSFITSIVMSHLSDRLGLRGVFICAMCCMAGTGFLILSLVGAPAVRYFAIFLVVAGGYPVIGLSAAWVTDNQGSSSKRGGGLIVFGVIGQCGSILGAHLFPSSQAPAYVKSMALCAGMMFFGAIVALFLSFCLRQQNRARDLKYGKADPKKMPTNISDIGDEHPMYRYIT